MSGQGLLLGNTQHVDVASTNKKDIMHSQLTITMYVIDTYSYSYSYSRLSTIYVDHQIKLYAMHLCCVLNYQPRFAHTISVGQR